MLVLTLLPVLSFRTPFPRLFSSLAQSLASSDEAATLLLYLLLQPVHLKHQLGQRPHTPFQHLHPLHTLLVIVTVVPKETPILAAA